MELVDTHCHIQSVGNSGKGEHTTRELWGKAGSMTPTEIIENAAQAGVNKMICVGCDLNDSRLSVDFVQNRPECWASVGIHPHEAQHYAGQPEKLQEFAALAHEPKVVAIGECGLDYFYTHSPKNAQIEVLKFQMELALKHDLPMIFHVREAFDNFWPVFEAHKGKIRGVLHSFTDTKTNLERAISQGLYIGVNGIATFAKNPAQLDMYKAVPLERLVLETDAPFLTPTPYRGTINEPKNIRVIAEFLAGLRGEKVEVLASATSVNAQTLFGI